VASSEAEAIAQTVIQEERGQIRREEAKGWWQRAWDTLARARKQWERKQKRGANNADSKAAIRATNRSQKSKANGCASPAKRGGKRKPKPPPRITSDMRRRIRSLNKQGFRVSKIAELLQITETEVHQEIIAGRKKRKARVQSPEEISQRAAEVRKAW
jgi:hypothetical protein